MDLFKKYQLKAEKQQRKRILLLGPQQLGKGLFLVCFLCHSQIKKVIYYRVFICYRFRKKIKLEIGFCCYKYNLKKPKKFLSSKLFKQLRIAYYKALTKKD